MKKLALLTWEQLLRLLDFLFEVMKWVMPVVLNMTNTGKEEKKDEHKNDDQGAEKQ